MRRNYFTERDFAPRKQPNLIANRKSSSAFRISANSCAKEEKSGLNFFHAPEVSLYIDREGQGIRTFGQFTLGIALSSFKPGDPFSLRAPAWTLSWLLFKRLWAKFAPAEKNKTIKDEVEEDANANCNFSYEGVISWNQQSSSGVKPPNWMGQKYQCAIGHSFWDPRRYFDVMEAREIKKVQFARNFTRGYQNIVAISSKAWAENWGVVGTYANLLCSGYGFTMFILLFLKWFNFGARKDHMRKIRWAFLRWPLKFVKFHKCKKQMKVFGHFSRQLYYLHQLEEVHGDEHVRMKRPNCNDTKQMTDTAFGVWEFTNIKSNLKFNQRIGC